MKKQESRQLNTAGRLLVKSETKKQVYGLDCPLACKHLNEFLNEDKDTKYIHAPNRSYSKIL